MIKETEKRMRKAADDIRKNIVKMAYYADKNGAHLGGGLSLPEILSVLYLGVMNVSPENIGSESRDRLIFSKGHGAIALYAALKEAGFLSEEELFSFKRDGADFWTHPRKNVMKGIEFASGSLGQGLSLAAGVAIGLREKKLDSRVYVVIGDGECDEGSVWEAASFVAHHKLNNITVVIDENKLQLDAPTREIVNKDQLAERWQSFGFDIVKTDGHDIAALLNAFSHRSPKPIAIMAQTTKGKGVSFIENNPEWHMHTLSAQQFEQAMKELENV